MTERNTMPTTNLSDRWARYADTLTESKRDPRPDNSAPSKLPPAFKAAAAALTPAELERLRKAGLIKIQPQRGAGGVVIDKRGDTATQLGAVLTVWINVTPDIASCWLTNNVRNRALSRDVVIGYAREMLAGQWVTTHQGVAFNDRDELIDGQHRLEAIIVSGCTIKMMATFGLPSKIQGKEMTTMDAVDRGKARSVASQLAIQHGIKDSTVIAGMCANLAGLCFKERLKRPSVGQALEVYRAFERSILWVATHRARVQGLRAVGVLTAFAFAHAVIPDLVEPRFIELMTGKGLAKDSPLSKLREFLLGDEAALFTRGMDRGLAELVLNAIQMQLDGKPAAKLHTSPAGADHFRDMQQARAKKIAKLFELPTDSTFNVQR
jgi:hydrogenase maturation factor